MRRVALALALLLCADIAVDSMDIGCDQAAASQPCCACVCQIHGVAPASTVRSSIIPLKPLFAVPSLVSFAGRLTDKSLFRPPKLLA